jgi:hypothetical protein
MTLFANGCVMQNVRREGARQKSRLNFKLNGFELSWLNG